jgi:rhodanese-related sulfurtransferase
MKHINISEFKNILAKEGTNPRVDFINVCTPTEYKEKHINGVRSVPLDTLESHLQEFSNKDRVYVHCRSGARGRTAIEYLKSRGVHAELINVEGGLLAWEAEGLPTRSEGSAPIPLMRQVFLAAGLLILIGNAATYFIAQPYLILSTAIGLGLTFSGLTGWCGMALLLSKMPWNK